MGRLYEAMGVEIQQNMAIPDWGGFYLERCEEILIRGDGSQCRRRAVSDGQYCALHTRQRAEAGGPMAAHPCTVPDCTEPVVYGKTEPSGTIWFCREHGREHGAEG